MTLDDLILKLRKIREEAGGEAKLFVRDSRTGVADKLCGPYVSKVSDSEMGGDICFEDPGTTIIEFCVG